MPNHIESDHFFSLQAAVRAVMSEPLTIFLSSMSMSQTTRFFHVTDQLNHGLSIGDEVEIAIDWAHRF